MRGKGITLKTSWDKTRITPAHAGKRFPDLTQLVHRGDHPRACGEKSTVFTTLEVHQGSPPRMRGKGRFRNHVIRPGRITPAHAGKSAKSSERRANVKDHPRACGEKWRIFFKANWKPGSPPRMRGKGFRSDIENAIARITPAHAGKRQ